MCGGGEANSAFFNWLESASESARLMPRRKKAKGPAAPKAPKAPPRSATDALSEYELLRLAHIKRNQEFLASLGLVGDNACAGSATADSTGSAGATATTPSSTALDHSDSL